MSEGLFANVIIDISHESVDRTFQYAVPLALKDSISVGDCVIVPFGKGNTQRKAFVLELTFDNDYPIEKIKEIIAIDKTMACVEQDAIRLAIWMKNTYGSTTIAALKTVLPAKKKAVMKERKKIVRKQETDVIMSFYAQALRKKHEAKARILKELLTEELLPYELVVEKLNVSSSTLLSLQRDDIITIESESYYRNPVKVNDKASSDVVLSTEQKSIVDIVASDMKNGIDSTEYKGRYLIHGITGSGKTEVYIQLIKQAISKGKQCIMLIPEISLTYQTLMRFYKHFGDRVSVMNSTLTPAEKYDQCERAKNGEIDIIIGPRSALFVPFNNLGMIIMDEEHEGSYISEQNPRYHTRETAEELARIKGAMLVLGSATPSMEAYYGAQNGRYRLLKLTKRLAGNSLAKTSIVDMRKELKDGNKSIFSRSLQEKIKDRLEKKEQTILFLNRRGYAGFISCRACGYVMKCPHCDVSLSKHRGNKLKCHYCGFETADVKTCPECSSKYILGFKAGTQQIEEAINKLFPDARVLRMDADTTKTKDSYEKILSAFSEHKADILVGTQMIVKGHDFPLVTLMGVIAADISLNDSDFRSGEKTFQLLCQAVGRSGRGHREGEAVIQTYRPEHYSIVQAANQDYEAFYEEEIVYRMIGDYPPCAPLLCVLVSSKDERRALGLATALKKRIPDTVRVIGPAPSTISKINDMYRFNLYLKSKDSEAVFKARSIMEEYLETAPLISEIVTFDVV